MSGHSKWATIKRAKGATDAKRGVMFTKLGKLITIAARDKGGDIDTNFSLRMAIDKAKQANMPKDNIERAIKRGTGEVQGEQIEELLYEGIGPAGSQYVIKSVTDNKNRSASSIRHVFTKFGGSFGSVMWNFSKSGVVRILNDNMKEYNTNLQIVCKSTNYEYANNEAGEEFELELIEAGAQDIQKEDEGITIITNMEDLVKLKKFLDEKEIKTESAEIEYIAKEKINLEKEDQEKIERFEEELDECEDVGDYFSNIIM